MGIDVDRGRGLCSCGIEAARRGGPPPPRGRVRDRGLERGGLPHNLFRPPEPVLQEASLPSPVLQVRLPEEALAEVKRRGGSTWAREVLLEALDGEGLRHPDPDGLTLPRLGPDDVVPAGTPVDLPAPEGEPLIWPGQSQLKREPALPWSVICRSRQHHQIGIPCPECKGTGPR